MIGILDISTKWSVKHDSMYVNIEIPLIRRSLLPIRGLGMPSEYRFLISLDGRWD